ncbi:hypothetical protein J437_LFUL018336 [Ladona fulva]|uniref:Peptidase A2 domain-containing protein n=1 Tax=Ladona fulva TaxID=123851 RepID=A0A8K0KNK1_LADFU|nr:hypothetical protein J437_LFUL018336 [Ladona fulva]
MEDEWISDVAGPNGSGYGVKVKIGLKNVHLLIDTGATASLIKENRVDPFGPLSPSTIRLRGVTGHALPLLGAITLPVETLYEEFPQQFHVVGKDFKLPCDGILGLDFLRNYDASIDFTGGRIRLRDTTLPLHPLPRKGDVDLRNVAETTGSKQPVAEENNTDEGKRGQGGNAGTAKSKGKKGKRLRWATVERNPRQEVKRENARNLTEKDEGGKGNSSRKIKGRKKNEDKERANAKEREENKLTVAEKEAKSFQVRVGKVVKLPPRSEAVTYGYYDREIAFTGQALLMEPAEITIHGIMAARCIVKPTSDCRIPVKIINVSTEELTIPAKTIVGTITEEFAEAAPRRELNSPQHLPEELRVKLRELPREIARPLEELLIEYGDPLEVNYSTDTNYAAELRARLNIAFKEVRERLRKSHDQQAKYYNRGSKEANFGPGDRVFLHVPFVGIGRKRKLSRQWQGPYRVLEQTSPVNFRVQHISRPRDCQLVHANRLKIARGIHPKPSPSPPARGAITNPPPPKAPTPSRSEMRQPPPFLLEADLLPPLPPEPPPSMSAPAPPPPPNHSYALRSRDPVVPC